MSLSLENLDESIRTKTEELKNLKDQRETLIKSESYRVLESLQTQAAEMGRECGLYEKAEDKSLNLFVKTHLGHLGMSIRVGSGNKGSITVLISSISLPKLKELFGFLLRL